MADLTAGVSYDENGKWQLDISESSQKTERKPGSQLGKEDFLLLLVTQMQYQDPLDPADNTEFVAQLAQFSALEQMSNLNSTMNNSSAYSLVGKEVLIRTTTSAGDYKEVQGKVDFVTIKNGEAYVSIEGADYAFSDVVQVIDKDYIIAGYLPSVEKQKHQFIHSDPQDVKISGIDLGSHGYEATSFAVVLVDDKNQTTTIDPQYLSYKDGVVTIDKEALAGTLAGTYHIAFVFDDPNTTMDYDNVTLVVKGIVREPNNNNNNTGSTGDDSGADTGDSGSGEGNGDVTTE